jgi:LacI family transcriptional regulator
MADSTTSKHVAVAIELHWNLPWHLDCFQGIVDYGQEQGWRCVTDPYLTGATGSRDLSRYDGVVGRINPEMAERASAIGMPAVTLLYLTDLHSVRSDAEASARLAGEHLVGCGYRRLGHIGSSSSKSRVSQAIFDAVGSAAIKLGCPLPIDTSIEADDLSDPVRSLSARQTLTEWISGVDKPIGLYIQDMATARYLTQICTELGLRVPKDVGIIVHGADKLTATHITPTLSEVAIDHWEQGYQAAAVLDRLMQGEQVEPKTRYISSPRIIKRESTDQFICDDELVSQAMRFIAEHSRRSIQGEDVAAALEVSRRTLDRRFEQVLGKTLSQEIIRARLQQIETTLVESELTMFSIAELFGFGSASLFTQFFKKHAGMTPTAYRKRYRNDK